MNSSGSAIDLLIIEQSQNRAEGYVSTLRNGGLAVHPHIIDDPAGIDELLQHQAVDLILCSVESDGEQLLTTVEYCLKHCPEAPLLLLDQQQAPAHLLQALQRGARDVVPHNDPDRLHLVVKREYDSLVTRRQLAETQAKLQESEARCSILIDSSRDAIAYIHEGMHVRANPVYLEMFGYVEMDDIEGLPILDMIAPDDLGSFKKFLRSAGDGEQELEIRCQDSDGEVFDAVLEFSPASVDGEPCTQIIIRNNTIDKQLQERLAQVSTVDPLTELANRQHFMDRLESEIETHPSSDSNMMLLYLSIDGFQQIRAEAGIASSDNLLKEFTGVLQQQVDEQQLLARFGDHSFTLLCKCTADAAKTYADRLLQGLASHLFESVDTESSPSCSIGIAQFDAKTPNGLDFVNRAYHACESARAEGGSAWSFYDDEEMEASFGTQGNETQMHELIQHALEHDRFRLVYQPIVSMQGESREVYGVLTRLIDNNDEEILPDHFLRDAEQDAAQLVEIDRWVISHAVKELASQREEGRKVSFFISLSSAAVQDEKLLLWICDCVRENNAKGAWLTFQIKEEDIRKHIQQAKALIEGLTKITCQIAIDQYRGGAKSEALLKHLPISYVKFDGEFIEDLAGQPKKQERLTELNKQVHGYDIKTIATGVEDANSLAVLWTVGLNYIQGYFLQEPSENISYDFGAP